MSAAAKRNSALSLVEIDHGEVWTTSLLIAEKFGKRHADTLRAVENLECSEGFTERNFALSEYTDPTGRTLPMYRITRDGFAFLAMGFTGRAAAEWKELFIGAFNKMEQALRRTAAIRQTPEWIEAREAGKLDRRDFTDAVQALHDLAHDRLDSTTPLSLWMTGATRAVTSALFDLNGESVKAVRDRLTPRQLRRLGIAEDIYASRVYALLATDVHHKSICDDAKRAVVAFASVTGGREVPGVDRASRRLSRQSGSIAPHLAGLLLVAAPVISVLASWILGWGA